MKITDFERFIGRAIRYGLACLCLFTCFIGADGLANLVEPHYTRAAFSQLNSGSTPNRIFLTEANIFALDASAKKITVWQKTAVGTQVRQFSGIADVANAAGEKGISFSKPTGLAKHPTENIIAVSDRGATVSQILFYSYTESAEAVEFTYIGKFSTDVTTVPMLNPTDVAFYSNGDVAVSGNLQVGANAYVYRLTGAYDAMTFDSVVYTDESGTADGIEIDILTDYLYVASASSHCVYVYDGLILVNVFGVPGVSDARESFLNSPTDVALWRDSTVEIPLVLVADQANHRISSFFLESEGKFFTTIGKFGTLYGQFNKPYSVYVDESLVVADTINRRIQIFDVNFATLDSDGDGMLDIWETLYDLDPNDPTDANTDLDEDGLTNLEENALGTDPSKSDTDGDGFSDGLEIQEGTDPLDPEDFPEIVTIVFTAIDKDTTTFEIPTTANALPYVVMFTDSYSTNVTDWADWLCFESNTLTNTSSFVKTTLSEPIGSVDVNVTVGTNDTTSVQFDTTVNAAGDSGNRFFWVFQKETTL